MTPRIRELSENSGLPGPRANLELMLRFACSATRAEADECLSFQREDLADSPDEYVAMCGVVASCILARDDIPAVLAFARRTGKGQSPHRSPRRESIPEPALDREGKSREKKAGKDGHGLGRIDEGEGWERSARHAGKGGKEAGFMMTMQEPGLQ